jgi:Trk-type K+ transport system membrane component
VLAAAGSGIDLGNGDADEPSEASRLSLAAVVLVGGLGGSVAGGMKWLLVFAISWPPLPRAPGEKKDSGAGPEGIARRLGLQIGLFTVTLFLITTFGLLLIEHRVAPAFQQAPTAAAAMLEAASAVGGAGLQAGVLEAVSGPNLSSGMRQSVDQYQYGLIWLMLAMYCGRALPIWMLSGRNRGPDLPPIP